MCDFLDYHREVEKSVRRSGTIGKRLRKALDSVHRGRRFLDSAHLDSLLTLFSELGDLSYEWNRQNPPDKTVVQAIESTAQIIKENPTLLHLTRTHLEYVNICRENEPIIFVEMRWGSFYLGFNNERLDTDRRGRTKFDEYGLNMVGDAFGELLWEIVQSREEFQEWYQHVTDARAGQDQFLDVWQSFVRGESAWRHPFEEQYGVYMADSMTDLMYQLLQA